MTARVAEFEEKYNLLSIDEKNEIIIREQVGDLYDERIKF